MKKTLLCFLALFLGACSTYYDGRAITEMGVEFIPPTKWNGRIFPSSQICRAAGGVGSTPALSISNVPAGTNLIILEINNMDIPAHARNGGLGSIGFYHNGGDSAALLPVPGETFNLPDFAFEEKASRINEAKPYPYYPPCLEKGYHYSATVKAVHRTGSFDKQKTVLLGVGEIELGKY